MNMIVVNSVEPNSTELEAKRAPDRRRKTNNRRSWWRLSCVVVYAWEFFDASKSHNMMWWDLPYDRFVYKDTAVYLIRITSIDHFARGYFSRLIDSSWCCLYCLFTLKTFIKIALSHCVSPCLRDTSTYALHLQ